ncbi:MAG: universal stress protein [Phycisphaerales bacterium]|nr:universal stress protein [Phycisphaerales bacterium]
MDRLRSIVVGVDFSEASAVAMRQAQRLALWSTATVHPVHVAFPPVEFVPDPVFYPLPMVPAEDVVADAKAAWAEFGKDVPGRAALGLEIIVGQPLAELQRFAKERGADLIIVGASQASGRGVGTFAAACVRHPACKVLIVRESTPGVFRRMVVGVDFSDNSARALEAAARFAAQDSADVRIVHIFSPPWKRSRARATDALSDEQFRERYRDALKGHLRAFCEKTVAEMAYLRPRYEVHEDDSPGRGLLAAIAGADLVVVGTHGRSNLREFLLGRTTDRVLREAACSILAVPGCAA